MLGKHNVICTQECAAIGALDLVRQFSVLVEALLLPLPSSRRANVSTGS
jgi:hypothetical protein